MNAAFFERLVVILAVIVIADHFIFDRYRDASLHLAGAHGGDIICGCTAVTVICSIAIGRPGITFSLISSRRTFVIAGNLRISHCLRRARTESRKARLFLRRCRIINRPHNAAKIGCAGGHQRIQHASGAINIAQLHRNAVGSRDNRETLISSGFIPLIIYCAFRLSPVVWMSSSAMPSVFNLRDHPVHLRGILAHCFNRSQSPSSGHACAKRGHIGIAVTISVIDNSTTGPSDSISMVAAWAGKVSALNAARGKA